MKSSYKFKFFLNASHAVRWENGTGEAHPHTYEITCEVELPTFLRFDKIEEQINQVLTPLEGQFLNELGEFEKVNPTLEELTRHLFEQIERKVAELDCKLIRIEVGESPTRYYCLTN